MSKNKFIRRKQQSIKSAIINIILVLGIGYALLQQNLNITGTANLNNPNWNIHWENVQVTSGSVSGANVVTAPTISNQTTVTYSIILNKPGDYYEFTVDAVNSGTIDGMIDGITSKLNGVTITNLPAYLKYTVSYSDGAALKTNQLLAAGTTEKYKVRLEYNTDIELEQIPASDQTLSLQFTVKYRQATSSAIEIEHPTQFEIDSWDTIISNIRSGNVSNYNVGDTKEIDLGTLGIHTLRIANKSTPSACSNTGYSQSACGFVLEFTTAITKRAMNSSSTNTGGWQSSGVRTYVNSTVYNAIPTNLKNAIIDTSVVSGHGSDESTNFTTTDKIYLLSLKEAGINYSRDSARSNTRVMDYYSANNNVADKIKYDSSNDATYWWLRTPSSNSSNYFYTISNTGNYSDVSPTTTRGVCPAFRIG